MHLYIFFFFFNDTATTEIYTLSLHDALPISRETAARARVGWSEGPVVTVSNVVCKADEKRGRSEEHTSELQSPCNLVCRLLLEKKKKIRDTNILTAINVSLVVHKPLHSSNLT